MIETETIRNLEEPPFIFGLRADYFVPAISICSAIFVLSILGILFLVMAKMWLGVLVILICAAGLLALVMFLFRQKSIIKPFKGVKKVADVITNINLIEITER